MGHLQKIILLVLIVPLALFPGGLISYILMFEQLQFEISMWIPIGITILGVCSFIFQFKTKKFYRLLKKNEDLPHVDPLLWILDVAFGVAYLVLAFYLVYLLYVFPTKKSPLIFLMVVLPMFIAGAWTVSEAFYLHKLIRIHKHAHRHAEIEDIKGNMGE